MGRETLEPQELAETEEAGRSAISTRVAVTAAILAVLAQSRASDEWALRQAKSIKLHIQEVAPPHEPTDVERQRAEITASEERAREAEHLRDEANHEAGERFEQHHRFAVGTSLLQIAIVLETVAAVLGRPHLWWGGIIVGALGAAAFANGFLGIV